MQGKIEIAVGVFVLAALAVFAYMGFKVGAFRCDRSRYNEYTIFFKDISGLSRKAEVKIAGVKVGWVEDFTLHADGYTEAEVKVMVVKDYSLYSDAYAIVRQQGLLGPTYLEIITGDPLLKKLQSGDTLSKPNQSPVSMDELLQQFKKIASNVEQITDSFKEVVGADDGKQQLRSFFNNLSNTAEKLSSFSDILERSFVRNEDGINDMLALGKDFKRISGKLEDEIFPAIKNGFNRFENTSVALEEASIQARDGLKSLSSVAEKIDEGKGLLGKIINEDETYKDLKVAVSGLRNYFAKVDRLQIVFDAHYESMHRPAEHYSFEDSKGYFDVRVHPTEDYFYLVQLASSEKGFMDRHDVLKSYLDNKGHPVDVSRLTIDDATKLEFTYQQNLQILNRNRYRFGVQFGKIFKETVALRFGLFEGFAGMGVDVDIPTGTDKFRWVTTLEAFDFTGQNRVDDRRPHFKWLNRMFIMRNIYFTFGADDFASRHNANVFLGAGIRFGDDDVKFLLGGLGGAGLGGGGGQPFLAGNTIVSN